MEDLFERAKAIIPGGVNSPVRAFRSVGGTPFFTERAAGAKLYTTDGRELIDYVCTWGPAIHGHNHPMIKSAIATALEKGTSFGTPNPYEIEMAELLVELVPSVEKVRMVNSGTEATMSAIRLARGFTNREKIIKFAGCYHGHVDALLVKAGSGALTLGYPDSAGIPTAFANETIVLNYNDVGDLQQAFEQYSDTIAAVIVEPYPANVGLLLPQPGYLQTLRELCSANGSLLIFDEVMTGFRVSLGGIQEKEQVTPDLTAMGKIIGGGLPVGAFGGKADIMDHLAPVGPVYQAGTLSGNPLAMAAGLAALHLLKEQSPYAVHTQLAEILVNAIQSAATAKGIPVQVPHTASMFSIFFAEQLVTNFNQAVASDTQLFTQIFQGALKRGLYLPPSPFETCFISTAHEGDDIAKSCEILTETIADL